MFKIFQIFFLNVSKKLKNISKKIKNINYFHVKKIFIDDYDKKSL